MASSGYRAFGAVSRARPTHVYERSTVGETGTRARSEIESRPNSAGLEKKGWRWKRTRHSQYNRQDPIQYEVKLADLAMLEFAAADGEIDLKYLDEAGFCLSSPISYSYSRVGEQKRLEQVPTRGNCISILGLWQPDYSFDYALAQGGFEGDSYLKVMDWIADKAAMTFAQTGRFTVVVQDNCKIHKCELVKQHWQRWETQGLLLFFLPPYSAHLNRIEAQWHQLKAHESAGQMFEDEYDLAKAVIQGMEVRSHSGGYTLERFNSA
jgi:putative transposase